MGRIQRLLTPFLNNIIASLYLYNMFVRREMASAKILNKLEILLCQDVSLK